MTHTRVPFHVRAVEFNITFKTSGLINKIGCCFNGFLGRRKDHRISAIYCAVALIQTIGKPVPLGNPLSQNRDETNSKQ